VLALRKALTWVKGLPGWAWALLGAFVLGARWRHSRDTGKIIEVRAEQADAEATRADADADAQHEKAKSEKIARDAHEVRETEIEKEQDKIIRADLDDLADFVNETFDD